MAAKKRIHVYVSTVAAEPADGEADADTQITALQTRLLADQPTQFKPVSGDDLMFVLHDLGWFKKYPEEEIDDATASASSLMSGPTRVTFDAIKSVPRPDGKHALLLCAMPGSAGIQRVRGLHFEFKSGIGILGVPQSSDDYEPQVVLFEDWVETPLQAIDPISWTVEALAILYDEGETGELIGIWPLVEAVPGETVKIDDWRPDFRRNCMVCGETPVVLGYFEGKLVLRGNECGVCFWQDRGMSDPKRWNE